MKCPVSVDVLIVSYNSAPVLRDCLASIRRHRPRTETVDLRVHVYDNASQDGTAGMVATEFPEVLLLRSPTNEGFGAANNALAAESQADFLLLLNPDTVWESDVVTPLLAEMWRHPGAVVAAPRLVYPDGRQQLSSQLLPGLRFELAEAIRGTKLGKVPGFRGGEEVIVRIRDIHSGLMNGTHEGQFLWATCWLIDAHWVRHHGLFDERFMQYDEDLDFCFRLRRAGAEALYVPSVKLIHIGGASSTPREKLKLTQEARAQYYRVNHGLMASLTYRFLILPLGRLRLKRATRRESRERLQRSSDAAEL